MSLPVTNEYLAKALTDGVHAEVLTERDRVSDVVLKHYQIGSVMLTSGRLVACDPLVPLDSPHAEHFDLILPKGNFPVTLSIAMLGTDQRVAFATLRFRETPPVAWDMLTVADKAVPEIKPGQIFGYPVDTATGCFMDSKAAIALRKSFDNNPDLSEDMITELEKTYVNTWGWINHKLCDEGENMVAFTTGFGDGLYASYAGFDADSEVSVIVTDFGVVERN